LSGRFNPNKLFSIHYGVTSRSLGWDRSSPQPDCYNREDKLVSTSGFVRGVIFNHWLLQVLLPLFRSSRFAGNILASKRQIKSTVFINKYQQGFPSIRLRMYREPVTITPLDANHRTTVILS
ncbi:hypothetical protein T07_9859, partial [Trichinella nelsoni]